MPENKSASYQKEKLITFSLGNQKSLHISLMHYQRVTLEFPPKVKNLKVFIKLNYCLSPPYPFSNSHLKFYTCQSLRISCAARSICFRFPSSQETDL